MDFWFPLIGGASAGAVISGLFGFLKITQDRTNEHGQWLRNQKIEAYTNLLRQAHASIRARRAVRAGEAAIPEGLEDIKDVTNARLLIVGSGKVRSAANWHFNNLEQAFRLTAAEDYDAFEPTLQLSEARLEEAIREDLDTVERQLFKHSLQVWFFKWLVYPWLDPINSRYFRKHGHPWTSRKHYRSGVPTSR